MQVGISVDSLLLKHFFCCFTEVLAEGSPRPLSSVPDVTHHLVTMQSGRQSYEVSVLTAVNPQEVKLSLGLTLFLWRLLWRVKWGSELEELKNSPISISWKFWLEYLPKLSMSPALKGA